MKHRMQTAGTYRHSGAFFRQLDAYALAAGAAGVSLLALTEPAEARIVYTPVHKVIGNGESYKLDFNRDGITDLTIRNIATQSCGTDGTCWPIESLAAALSGTNQVVYNIYGAVAMKSGMRVGPGDAFNGGRVRMVGSWGSFATGSWINVKNRYLGVKFKIKGKCHFGWARLNVQLQPPRQVTATLAGYAYETIVGKAIIAGKEHGEDDGVEPATLGSLALGRK